MAPVQMAAPTADLHDDLVEDHASTGNDTSPYPLSSSDSDDPAKPVGVAEQDEADDMVGVSISLTQSWMKARRTPAEEKNRMMERAGGYFEPIPDVDGEGSFLPEITAEPESLEPSKPAGDDQQSLPRPSKNAQRSSFTRSILKNGLPLRPRAWSGDAISNLKLKKILPDLGSLAKRSSLSFRSISTPKRNRSQSPKPSPNSDRTTDSVDESVSELRELNGPAAAKHSYVRRPSNSVMGAPLSVRRSASDQSLYLRASSTASSLEQRPRYENIHSQVNSRFKAIKDSLQDSSSRLLSMPTLHFQDMRSEWGYKPTLTDANHRMHPQDVTTIDSPAGNPGKRDPQFRARSSRTNSSNLFPILSEAMSEMTGDVVIMGGYRGSILRSAKPPQRQLWVPMKVGLNLRKVDLEVGLNPEDEENMEDTIIPSGVLSHVGPVDVCRRLIKQLQKCDNALNGDLRVWNYGYDWRLSPHLLARKLIKYLEGLPCNAPDVPPEKRGAYVIAHSLGGLITRHAVNQRPELFAGVVYAGVPQHCVNILGPLRNGDDVLLSSRVLTAQVNFTFRTSFALLPENGRCFIDKRTKEEYPVDFFSVETWDEYRLSPCINPPLPPLAGKGFMDNLPRKGIAKRFSTVLSGKDSLADDADLPAKSGTDDEQGAVRDNWSVRAPPRPSHPVSNVADKASDKASALKPSMDGVVGPTSTPKTSATTKAAQVCTIPRHEAVAYLKRTLDEVLRFKQELAFNPAHQSENRYPPAAVLYGKSVPTVYGARVGSRDQIKCQDAYDDLAFAAGDGVCLASAAMLPTGYLVIKDGLVRSDRGHVGLLGDLEGVGQCLRAIVRGRREGVGLGNAR